MFRHVLDNSPLEVKPRPNEVETDAVKSFKETGKNPYAGDEQALAEGKRLYQANCQACHLPDGSGRIGPTPDRRQLDIASAPQPTSACSRFSMAARPGAMQSFARRGMTQDQMLKSSPMCGA